MRSAYVAFSNNLDKFCHYFSRTNVLLVAFSQLVQGKCKYTTSKLIEKGDLTNHKQKQVDVC